MGVKPAEKAGFRFNGAVVVQMVQLKKGRSAI